MSDDTDIYSSQQLLTRLLELGKAQDFEAVQQISGMCASATTRAMVKSSSSVLN